jgi:hypothetical protein
MFLLSYLAAHWLWERYQTYYYWACGRLMKAYQERRDNVVVHNAKTYRALVYYQGERYTVLVPRRPRPCSGDEYLLDDERIRPLPGADYSHVSDLVMKLEQE